MASEGLGGSASAGALMLLLPLEGQDVYQTAGRDWRAGSGGVPPSMQRAMSVSDPGDWLLGVRGQCWLWLVWGVAGERVRDVGCMRGRPRPCG